MLTHHNLLQPMLTYQSNGSALIKLAMPANLTKLTKKIEKSVY